MAQREGWEPAKEFASYNLRERIAFEQTPKVTTKKNKTKKSTKPPKGPKKKS